MLPGGAEALKGADLSKQEKEFQRMEAMICGMTPQERHNPHILNARRRQRIAKGSGVSVTELILVRVQVETNNPRPCADTPHPIAIRSQPWQARFQSSHHSGHV